MIVVKLNDGFVGCLEVSVGYRIIVTDNKEKTGE